MSDARTIGFVGLGVMGYPMAGHLARAGHRLRVFNRTTSRANAWAAQHGGLAVATPRDAATGADCVLVCVGNDDDVRAVAYGADGILAGLARDATLIDHTTASAELARELAAAAADVGAGWLDAPVSGGQAGAENGKLTVMVGGDADVLRRAQPVLEIFARAVRLMGPAGAGQLTKMVNQICIAGVLQGLSEGLHFAERAGLDPLAVVDVIAKGAAQSWQMENRAPTMVRREFDFGFAVDWMRKDLRIALEAARGNGARLPLTALVDQFYADVQALGGGRNDTSSLIRRFD
ncbi:MAG: NAD(P)-dependent oxidoreductase [Gammaproteobacteria bacterium]